MTRRRSGLVPSLFPFLAVLVCTLGTLILLLALVARDAEETSKQVAEQARAEKLREIVDAARQERWRRDEILKLREQQTAVLETHRSELAHLEDHTRRIRAELEDLQVEIQHVLVDPRDAEEIEHDIEQLRQQIAEEKAALLTQLREKQNSNPRVVIVPHRGPNGTQRRPIYLECKDGQIIIQPEGVRIDVNQLRGPSGPGNPLDAALRTIRNYRQANSESVEPPYPLLIVRPSGVIAYSAARISMTAWDDQFGYELVPEEVELAFPNKNDVLAKKLDSAIVEAIRRRNTIVDAVPQRYGRGRPGSDPIGDVLRKTEQHRSASQASQGYAGSNDKDSSPIRRWNRNIDASLTTGSSKSPGGDATQTSDLGGRDTNAPSAYSDYQTSAGTQRRGLGGSQDVTSLETNGLPAGDGTSRETSQASNQRQEDTGGDETISQSEIASSGAASQGSAREGSTRRSASPPGTAANGGASISLATQRGQGWALAGTGGSSDGPAIVRSINVQCHRDRFIILDSSKDGEPITVLANNSLIDASVIRVAQNVRERVDSWGLALTGGRWQPILQVDVTPGGEANFETLRTLLDGSGIIVKRRSVP